MKSLGDISEVEFLLTALKNSITSCVPWGEKPYEVITDYKNNIKKVQVKSTNSLREDNYYQIGLRKKNGELKYQRGDFDIIAVHIIPEYTWYIIPFDEIENKTSLYFTPLGVNSPFKKYIEAWGLLK